MSKATRRPYAEALAIAQRWEKILAPYCERIQLAGSLRRQAEDVGDVEFVVIPKDKTIFMECLNSMGFTGKKKSEAFRYTLLQDDTQIEVYMTTPESWSAALLYATGPKQYTIRLRALATRSRGMLLNHNGLFKKDTNEMVAGATEEEILERLGSRWRSPKERVK